MQNSVISTWIVSLYVTKPSFVFFACKRAPFCPELQVSVGPRPHLSFCACKTACLASELLVYGFQPSSVIFGCETATFGPEQQVSIGPRHHLSFCACKTEWLAQELLVFMGPSPHLWIFDAKQRLFGKNYKSLWVPDFTSRFVHAKQHDIHQTEKSLWVPALKCDFFHAKQRL